jgi:hypothetical protein
MAEMGEIQHLESRDGSLVDKEALEVLQAKARKSLEPDERIGLFNR